MQASVRLAQSSDASAVTSLTHQLGYDVDPSAVEQRLARILERPDQRFMIADVDGRSVGWVHAAIWEFIENDACVIIGGLVVDASHRGRGIGRILMRHAENWAMEQGCSIVRLWSSATRTNAHRFYERLGYTNVKTQYSFAKSCNRAESDRLSELRPRVNR